LPAHTASWASNAIVSNTSLYSSQSNWAISSSYASSSTTAGTATNLGLTAYNISVTNASQSQWSVSSSYSSGSTTSVTATNLGLTAYNISVTNASQSRWATSASFASSSITSSYLPPGTYQITASWTTNLPDHTASWARNSIVSNTSIYSSQSQWAVSSSYASSSTTSVTATNLGLTAYNISVTFASQSRLSISASYASSSLSASYSSFTGKTNNYLPKWLNNELSATSSIVDTGSFIGIGTFGNFLAPNKPLHVAGNDPSGSIGTAGVAVRITNTNIDAAGKVSEIQFASNNGQNVDSQSFALVSAVVVGAGPSTFSQGDLSLTTRNASGTWNTGVYIKNTGNVGVGTNNPTHLLTVAGQVTATGVTGSLRGTASYASQALSASYAPFTETYQDNTTSASWASSSLSSSYLPPGTYQITSSWVINLPEHTASWARNSIVSNTSLYSSQSNWSVSASFASSSTTAGTSITATTATNLGLTAYNISVTFASQSQWSVSSSYASASTTAGTATNLGLTAYNISVTYASQSQWSVSSSYASGSLSASYATIALDVINVVSSASYSLSASYAPVSPSVSASYSLSSSYAPFIQTYQENATSASWASSSLTSVSSSYFNVVSGSGVWKQYVDFSNGNLVFLYS
jgi:hypothetical protein